MRRRFTILLLAVGWAVCLVGHAAVVDLANGVFQAGEINAYGLYGTQYRIDVPTGALSLTVVLDANHTDLNLLLKHNQQADLYNWDYISNSGQQTESINLDLPALNPGPYYFAIYNNAIGQSITYGIIAIVYEQPTVVDLVNGVSVGGVALADSHMLGTPHNVQYRISVPADANVLTISLSFDNMVHDLDLAVRHGGLVMVGTSDFSAATYNSPEIVQVNALSSPPLQAGDYYIGIGNFFLSSYDPASFTLTAQHNGSGGSTNTPTPTQTPTYTSTHTPLSDTPTPTFTHTPTSTPTGTQTPPPNAPVVFSLSRSRGSFYEIIEVRGENFGDSQLQADGVVLFDTLSADIVTWSSSTIEVHAPEVDDGIVRVRAFGQTSSQSGAPRFDIEKPVVLAADPGNIGVGETLTITGLYFGYAQGGESEVRMAGVVASIQSWSDEEILALVPDISGDNRTVAVRTIGGIHADERISIKAPASLTCNVQPTSPVLGQSFNVIGILTGAGQTPLAGETVFLSLIAPGSGTVDVGEDTTNLSGKFNINIASDATYPVEGAGSWKARAYFSGKDSIQAVSVESTFKVQRAGCAITADVLPGNFVQLGSDLRVSGNLSANPQFAVAHSLLQGVTVVIDATAPGSQAARMYAQSDGVNYQTDAFLANVPGAWNIAVQFLGNDDFLTSNRQELEVNVASTMGYAIIVTGQSSDQEGIEDHTRTTDFVYAKLVERNFQTSNIAYHNSHGSQINGVTTAASTKDNVRQAIREWASAKILQAAAPLFVVFVNHGDVAGGVGRFHVDRGGAGNPVEDGFITPSELDKWFDDLEDSISGLAVKYPIIFIDGACHSGSFLPGLSSPDKQRILISSCDDFEVSYRGPNDQLPRDGEYFTTRFFAHAAKGNNLKRSFELASKEVGRYTLNKSGNSLNGAGQKRYSDDADQHPQLDDNGDGVSETIRLKKDGDLAVLYNLGISQANPPTLAEISTHIEDVYLSVGQADPQLWMRSTDPGRVSSAWIEIKCPTHELPPVDPSESLQRSQDLPKLLRDYRDGDTYYWTTYNRDGFGDFSGAGEYIMYYFLKDTAGEIASIRSSRVYRNHAGNQLPTPFSLTSPASGSQTTTRPVMQWGASSDPEGGAIHYMLMASTSEAFTAEYTHLLDDIDETVVVGGSSFGLLDNTTYYWKVVARDPFGATRESSQTWTVHTDNTNQVFGTLVVRVLDGMTGNRITDATVTLDPGVLITPAPSGAYLSVGLALLSSFDITVEKDGYRPPPTRSLIISSADELALEEFYLYRYEDVNQNGLIDSRDLLDFSNSWKKQSSSQSDMDGDNDCDEQDLLLLIDQLAK
jgi:Bacterial pre-peptidase C-terminal domain/Dockerin type I domain/IPT/TIG domain